MTGAALIPVPTTTELARRGLAFQPRKDDRWTITAAGDAELRSVMAHNARVLTENPDLRRRHEADAVKRARRSLT